VALNSRLESKKEKEEDLGVSDGLGEGIAVAPAQPAPPHSG